jgi:hypothetical protein
MEQREAMSEAVLCEAYAGLIEHYGRALSLVGSLSAAFERGEMGDDLLQQLGTEFRQVAAIESALSETKRLWKPNGRISGPALSSTIDRAARLMARLVEQIEQAENVARGRMSSVLLELDDSIRGQQMRQAYARNVNG